jgi:hypothetical protein
MRRSTFLFAIVATLVAVGLNLTAAGLAALLSGRGERLAGDLALTAASAAI